MPSNQGKLTRNAYKQTVPGLIPLIKKARPELPVIYRSHIEIRSDLAHTAGTPQQEVWQYLWDRIQHADLFISEFVMPWSY
jgi:hypothetical protein